MLKTIIALIMLPTLAFANSDTIPNKQIIWPFNGAFGSVDRQAAQRGFQVYKEVCSACHGIKHLYYRNLKGLGLEFTFWDWGLSFN